MAVWLAQCLCPDRHAILALAGEAESENEASEIGAQLRQTIGQLGASGVLNPWCGLCGAGADTWTYEIGRTGFASLAEAEPILRQNESEQAVTRALWGDLHKGRAH